MKPPARTTMQSLPRLALLPSRLAAPSIACRAIHSSPSITANVASISQAGPPPDPPQPAVEHYTSKIARRRRQAEMLKNAKEIRTIGAMKSAAKSPLKRRFWQDVHIKEVDGAYQVHLDSRPLRHPTTKTVVTIPLSKPHLAHAIALEWDLLTSAQQATKTHLIPLTSLVCRALDIAADDVSHSTSTSSEAFAPIRTAITTMLLRYLDTDSLLCWAPPANELFDQATNKHGESLRSLQERTAGEIVGFLTSRVWPGVEIGPVLDGTSIMPREQAPGVREVVQGWVIGLEPWDLAGLERATLAGKSMLGAVRLLVDWSEGSAGRAAAVVEQDMSKFGVEEAAQAASLEVDWQTGRWGEVEDTHDVEKEDLRRQLGSVILLVSGTGSKV